MISIAICVSNSNIFRCQTSYTAQQEQQLSDINQRAAQLTERQSELAQGLVEQQQRGAIPQQNPAQLADTLSNLSAELANTDDEEAGEKIKSWIEQG